MQYILWTLVHIYDRYCALTQDIGIEMIKIRINELLKEQRRSFYWLAKETGVSHTTLWRLRKGKAHGITFGTLDKISQALKCQPGDLLKLTVDKPRKTKVPGKASQT